MFFYKEIEEIIQSIFTNWTEAQKITASDKQATDYFGYSTAISSDGSTIVVGAYAEDPNDISSAGSAYIFTKSGGVWTEAQKITASDKQVGDSFGLSTAISSDGNTLVVSAPNEDPGDIAEAGSVYIFTKSGGVWTEAQKITASDKQVGDYFGNSTAISADGSTIVVGVKYEDPGGISNAGSVYIFTKSGGVWTEAQKITASDKQASDYFGYSTAISADGSTIVVGAISEDPDGISDAGSAYIFTKSGGVWTETQKITASDRQDTDYFGYSTAISSDGSTIVVGAYVEDPGGISNAGSVYIFTKSGGVWTEAQKITASDKQVGDFFGNSTAISADGSTIVVGAISEDPDGIAEAGSVYIFTKSGGVWTEAQKITASDKETDDRFGFSTAISSDGSTIVVGARVEDPGGISNAGSVYVFNGQ